MYNVVLYGFKGVGKSSLGKLFAEKLGAPFLDTDSLIEDIYEREIGERLSYRQIYKEEGSERFRQLEAEAVRQCATRSGRVIALGGFAFRDPASRASLRPYSVFVFLDAPSKILAQHIRTDVPPFLDPADLVGSIARRNEPYRDLYYAHADIVLDCSKAAPAALAARLTDEIVSWSATAMHSPSSFGHIVRMTTFGESHGAAVGVVLDGVPARLEFDVERIQRELDRRRPGQSSVTTSRVEKDRVHVLSGVSKGLTLGTPICMLIHNEQHDPSAYDRLRDVFRPGHADFTYWQKYGIRDHRGGGRSSGRETAARVAAGAFALSQVEKRGMRIVAHSKEIAGIEAQEYRPECIEQNPVRCADPEAAARMEQAILEAKERNDSVGGVVELRVDGVPAGLGDPVFYKLDAVLAHGLMSIGAVKGIEVGAGFGVARMLGSENNDEMTSKGFLSNNAGGILGGITTGQELVLHLAVKPPASIAQDQRTVDRKGHDTTINVGGRHDPCIVPRVIPVIESMTAWVLWNALLWQQRLHGGVVRARKGPTV